MYETNSDENEGQGRLTKLVVKQFEWHSDELGTGNSLSLNTVDSLRFEPSSETRKGSS